MVKFSDHPGLNENGFSDQIFGPPVSPKIALRTPLETWIRTSLASPKTALRTKVSDHPRLLRKWLLDKFSDHPGFCKNSFSDQIFGPPVSPKIAHSDTFGNRIRTSLASPKTALRTKVSDHPRLLRKLLFDRSSDHPGFCKNSFSDQIFGPPVSPKIAFRTPLETWIRTSLASPKTALRTKVSDHPRLLRKLLFGQVVGPPWLLQKLLFGPNFRTSGFSENWFSDHFFGTPHGPPRFLRKLLFRHGFGLGWFLRKLLFRVIFKPPVSPKMHFRNNSENWFSDLVGKCFRRTFVISWTWNFRSCNPTFWGRPTANRAQKIRKPSAKKRKRAQSEKVLVFVLGTLHFHSHTCRNHVASRAHAWHYRLNTGPAIFGHQHVQGDIRPWSQPFACGIHWVHSHVRCWNQGATYSMQWKHVSPCIRFVFFSAGEDGQYSPHASSCWWSWAGIGWLWSCAPCGCTRPALLACRHTHTNKQTHTHTHTRTHARTHAWFLDSRVLHCIHA